MAVNETPPFWFRKPGLKAWLLWPFSYLYNSASAANMLAQPSASVDAPVICIGNFVVGGGGKTPTAISLVKYLKSKGYRPGILSRGYSGKVTKATLVDLEKHNAKDVGDEPLLLAQNAKTVVSADRVAGANLLVELGCNFIIMDDGFQNPKLRKDFNLVVVDSKRGIGNGFAMPAGPLRVKMAQQMQKTDAILVVGNESGADRVIRIAARAAKPIYTASSQMINKSRWKDKSILPFAGIADPQKFFDSLKNVGAQIVQIYPFGDHHFFRNDEVKELLDKSELMSAQLVTTAKDQVRLIGMGELQEKLAEKSEVVEIKFSYESANTLDIILSQTIKRYEERMLAKTS